MKSPLVLSVALVSSLLLAGCGAPTTQALKPKESGTPVAHDPKAWLEPLGYERELLEQYFSDRESAFEEGTDQGVAFLVDNNLAGLGANPEACKNRWFGQSPEEHVREFITPKWSSFRRDPTWAMPVGPRAGQVLGDDIVEIVVTQELVGDRFLSSTHQTKMHFQIMGNGVRNLVLCEPIKTIAIEAPGNDPVLEEIPQVPQQSVPTFNPFPPSAPQFPQQTQPQQLPPIQNPLQPQRPQAPIVLPPIQSTGRPIVRPTPTQKPSQSPSQAPIAPPPSPTATARPSAPAQPEPTRPAPAPSSAPTQWAPSRPTSEPKPLPEAPKPDSGSGNDANPSS